MKSRLFFSSAYNSIQKATIDLLNSQLDFLSPNTLHSTRAAGDAIESIISGSFDVILGDWCAEYSSSFARRAMADLAFTDVDGFYYVVDVKTHRNDTKFNMPNLTSVERLNDCRGFMKMMPIISFCYWLVTLVFPIYFTVGVYNGFL